MRHAHHQKGSQLPFTYCSIPKQMQKTVAYIAAQFSNCAPNTIGCRLPSLVRVTVGLARSNENGYLCTGILVPHVVNGPSRIGVAAWQPILHGYWQSFLELSLVQPTCFPAMRCSIWF